MAVMMVKGMISRVSLAVVQVTGMLIVYVVVYSTGLWIQIVTCAGSRPCPMTTD